VNKEFNFEDIRAYIDQHNDSAYKDFLCTANPLLNKNPFVTSFYKDDFLKEKRCLSGLSKIKILLIYYLKTSIQMTLFLGNWTLLGWKQKSEIPEVLIDTFFVVNNIIKENSYKERYLPGLEKILKEKNHSYAYLPRWYSAKNPLKVRHAQKILKDRNIPFINIYAFVTIKDVIILFYWLIKYPFSILKWKKSISISTFRDEIFVVALYESLTTTTIDAYFRYLIAGKLAGSQNLKRIYSWSEGQLVDRLFYKGLKEGNSNAQVYGCQLFLQAKKQTYTIFTEVDRKFNLVPDIVLTNGPYYTNQSCSVPIRDGVALRSLATLESEFEGMAGSDILVLLPYYRDEMIELMVMLKSSSLAMKRIKIKPHPIYDIFDFSPYITSSWEIVDDNLNKLLTHSEIVITIGTSTSVDAVVMGKSILLVSKNRALMTNFLIDDGYKQIWDVATTSADIDIKFDTLLKFREKEPQVIKEVALRYKEQLFTVSTSITIQKAFDL
jgi:hypothetical protein